MKNLSKHCCCTRVGEVDIPAKATMLHQIVNGSQFNGAGGRVFDRFFEEVVVPSGGDLYLSVRAANDVACRFYERHGMAVAGKVAWAGDTLPGLVYLNSKRRQTATNRSDENEESKITSLPLWEKLPW